MTERDSPYKYQNCVLTHFQQGNDIVLQAPTGAGKTRAALEPGIMGFARDQVDRTHEYPPRILYAQPMRTLASSAFGKLLEAFTQKAWDKEWQPRIQTGDQPDDPLFEGKLIVATVDQILASFLTMPYSIPRRLDNINAGALIGSYLIFDEFHLYPRNEMMLTVVAMLKMLKGISRFTIMSATFSAVFLKAIADEVGAKFIGDDPEHTMFADVTNVQTQERTWHVDDNPLDVEAVRRYRGRRTLCVCNTVERAQTLYAAVRLALPDVDCVLLHARFYRRDRAAAENQLHQAFADDENSPERDLIFIATQVVEVGLDISADVLLTECAPAASLIQRAGRCARRKNQRGSVVVFQPITAGKVSYAPYDEDGLKDVCQRTWDALDTSEFDGRVLRFAEEQRLVDLAHGEADAVFVDKLGSKVNQRIGEITSCLANRNEGDLRKLVRKVSTVPVFTHNHPNGDETARDKERKNGLTVQPFRYESLSISRGQVYHLAQRLFESDSNDEVLIWGCDGEGRREQNADDEMKTVTPYTYQWVKLRSADEVYKGGYVWFTVHPKAVSYSTKMGFQFAPSAAAAPVSPMTEVRRYERIAYVADTYVEHITGLYHAYVSNRTIKGRDQRALRDEFLYPLERVCQQCGENATLGEQMLRLALALHDVGKLNRRWQAWATAWQTFYADNINTPTRTAADGALAHTDTAYDYHDENLKELVKNFKHPPRGTHAVESAEASLPVIAAACDGHRLWASVTTLAMMRHHTPDADSCTDFRMIDDAQAALMETLRVCEFAEVAEAWVSQIKPRFQQNGSDLKRCADFVKPAYSGWMPALLYLLFVRILRLADQRSSEMIRR